VVFTLVLGAGLVRRAEGLGTGLLLRVLPELMATMAGLALPVALLLATTFAFSRLAAEGELDAFRAAGIPARRLLPPVVLLALGVVATLAVVLGHVAPRAQHRLATTAREALRDLLQQVGSGARLLRVGATTIAWSDCRGGEVHDLRVLAAPDGQLAFLFEARRARLRYDAARDDLLFDVDRANLIKFDPEHGRFPGQDPIPGSTPSRAGADGRRLGQEHVIQAEAYHRLVVPLGEKFDRRPRLENLTLDELWGLRHTWCDNLHHGLNPARHRGTVRPWTIAAHDTERVKRVLLPFAPVFFVLIGAAMGAAARRRSRVQAAAFGLAPVLLLYYLPLQLCERLGHGGRWPAELAIGLPHAVLALVAVALCAWRCWR
jgi:lipopolysaccharide export LptBFGC system permease protein LptF